MKRNRETGFLFILQAKWFSFYFYFFISLTLHQKDDKNFIYQRRCPYICLIRIVISKNYVILDLSSNEVLNIWKRSACFHYVISQLSIFLYDCNTFPSHAKYRYLSVLSNNLLKSNPHIFATQCCKPLIFNSIYEFC